MSSNFSFNRTLTSLRFAWRFGTREYWRYLRLHRIVAAIWTLISQMLVIILFLPYVVLELVLALCIAPFLSEIDDMEKYK